MKNLQGKNILLRALEPSDLKLIYTWENEMTSWYENGNNVPVSEFTVENYLNSQEDIYVTKQLKLIIEYNKIAVGHLDIFDFDPANRKAGVGILITNKERNKGFAKEALELMIDYAFKFLRLHQIYCNIIIDNKISLRLFTKLGFEIKGTKKDWIQIGNEWKDVNFLQLINDEKI